jgi:hypothetical protein
MTLFNRLLVLSLLAMVSTPLVSLAADDFGPFLPPSTRAKQAEAAKQAEEERKMAESKEYRETHGPAAKLKQKLGEVFTMGTSEEKAKAEATPQPKRPPFITTSAPDLDDVPPLVMDDPLPTLPRNTRVDNPSNALGLAYVANELKGIVDTSPKTALAKSKTLSTWLVDATETHIDLYQTLSRVPSARVQAAFEKKLGLEFAKLRDQNLYLLGELYIENGDKRAAVRPLVQLIQSQSRTALGYKAYQLLQEIGFTEELTLTQR